MTVTTGGKMTRGPSEKDMVCSDCGRMFVVTESSWAAAERKPCPYCGGHETTPMLGKYEGAEPVLVKGKDGGYI